MTAPLSQDLRKRLVRAVEEGASARGAAARFAVSASAAIKLVRWVRQTGSTAPAKIGGYRKPLLARQEKFLRELTAKRKGITLAEIRVTLIELGMAPVVLDNCPAHKVAGVGEATRATSASLLYLPLYSPDLNPIEKAFAKLKALLRKASTRTEKHSGPPSAACPRPSPQPSAGTTSPTQAMRSNEVEKLV